MMYTQNNPLQKKIILYNYCTPEIIYNWPHVALVAFIKHTEKISTNHRLLNTTRFTWYIQNNQL